MQKRTLKLTLFEYPITRPFSRTTATDEKDNRTLVLELLQKTSPLICPSAMHGMCLDIHPKTSSILPSICRWNCDQSIRILQVFSLYAIYSKLGIELGWEGSPLLSFQTCLFTIVYLNRCFRAAMAVVHISQSMQSCSQTYIINGILLICPPKEYGRGFLHLTFSFLILFSKDAEH